MSWIAKHIFDVIVGAVLVLFVGTWLVLLIQTWAFEATEATPKLILNTAVVLAAGTLSTALGAQTSAALGFAVAEVKRGGGGNDFSGLAVGQKLTAMTYVAILAYVAVGLTVFFTWLADPVAPETVSTFALSILGWLVGALGVALKPVDA
ncbi:hypothetical protein BJ978_000820 [Agromyces terreus]|uniref:Uncharacterized protein n=1 Tax=Agromyces terreus TaxID=424795 RepID=A0A9X2H515_9MICO|nr:hypothetical protein [Agromyces terreus]MCP2370144.1 hypothetical protein [Agromyces terreus]